MPSIEILHEARQLHGVSDRLDSLADQHPKVSETLIGISGSIRNTATLLEVLVATQMPSLLGLDPAKA
jgi:exopolyphosphatase/pppGpp-phosphohydrolase